jgi:hypothetical protein
MLAPSFGWLAVCYKIEGITLAKCVLWLRLLLFLAVGLLALPFATVNQPFFYTPQLLITYCQIS